MCRRTKKEDRPTVGSKCHRHFIGLFNVPVQAPTRGHIIKFINLPLVECLKYIVGMQIIWIIKDHYNWFFSHLSRKYYILLNLLSRCRKNTVTIQTLTWATFCLHTWLPRENWQQSSKCTRTMGTLSWWNGIRSDCSILCCVKFHFVIWIFFNLAGLWLTYDFSVFVEWFHQGLCED